MTTVFLSGSRGVGKLSDALKKRVDNIVRQGFRIVVGDANGADKAFQDYLSRKNYRGVNVYFAGETLRNNLGDWEARQIFVDPKVKGRDLYVQKDKAMANEADFGLVLWNGKSAGSIGNVMELLKRNKPVVVYLSPQKHFFSLNQVDDILQILSYCSEQDCRDIAKKVGIEVNPKVKQTVFDL